MMTGALSVMAVIRVNRIPRVSASLENYAGMYCPGSTPCPGTAQITGFAGQKPFSAGTGGFSLGPL